MKKWAPVSAAWLILRWWVEERPPDVEGSGEYIE
jgi:hypothetical protein